MGKERRKVTTYYNKDGSPIRTDHNAIHSHKIAALVFLVIDNGDEKPEFKELVDQCVEVADDIFDNVEKLKTSNYIQDLENTIERKVAKNIYEQMLILAGCLLQANANSDKALQLITIINQIVGQERASLSHIRMSSKLDKLHRICKKNYKPIK